MKQLTNYQRIATYLVKIFRNINEEYFNNELETPTITIQSALKEYGHITTKKVWHNKDKSSYELNISADYLHRPIENVVCTLIHECCHLYNLQNDIKDTSNQGVYHNKQFKKIAEEKGLIVKKHDKYGFAITEPSEKTIDFCIKYDLKDLELTRFDGLDFFLTGFGNSTTGTTESGKPKTDNKKPTSTRKYICPCCGNSFRATKEINVMCMDCNQQFILAE